MSTTHFAAALAAGLESVTFKCDPAKAAVSEACPPSGLLQWNCSADCPDAECDINFGGYGLFGTIPEIGDLRCAHRFARVYAPPAARCRRTEWFRPAALW